MLAHQKVAVVIPAHRAADTIEHVVRGLADFVDVIVVVDDASPDRTAAVCAALREPRLVLLSHDRNEGVGGAVVTGLRRAVEAGADIIAKIDADGQMDPASLPDLLAPLLERGFDYAKGNRFYDLKALAQMPWARRWGNVALSFSTKLASGYWNIYDPQNGYVAIRREAFERLDPDGLDRGYFFENSMLIQLNIIGARVADVPMPARYGEERSSMRLGRVLLGFPPKLLRGWWMRMRLKYFGMDFSPIAVLLSAGACFTVAGISYGVYEWVLHARRGVATPAGTVMLAALPVLLGVQLLLNALLLDIANTPPGDGIKRIARREKRRP